MDNRAEIREFLTTRRAKITPGRDGTAGRPRLTLTADSTEPGSASEDALNLLAGWTATPADRH